MFGHILTPFQLAEFSPTFHLILFIEIVGLAPPFSLLFCLSFEQQMVKLREELSRLHEEEKFKEEKELEAASKRQKAINDLDRGVRNNQII